MSWIILKMQKYNIWKRALRLLWFRKIIIFLSNKNNCKRCC